ncbi:MAG: CPBP family intramembrane metalloprotease [Okeania sp. SIO2C2]|uniref:CPBP family glutamic-type intramembrane protease n=1 Tax=Okeania sp. SIO2C2 TaxID=2607787 RepID=UPI0013B65541|nr:CPBP family glutamic-type intramembrane protease [Okeania sp. SIO2C2]NEP89056.1 CPBP family intramembrane metalloprotease [Okeania sp. SIO2C2]
MNNWLVIISNKPSKPYFSLTRNWIVIVFLISLTLCLLFPTFAQTKKPSNYDITSQIPFNQPSYYPLQQTINNQLYRPTTTWGGRLILPKPDSPPPSNQQDWVWIEIYNAPETAKNLEGEILPLQWSQQPLTQTFVETVTKDIQFSQAAKNSSNNGNVLPTRLNGLTKVGPLKSLAGARPNDDMIVGLENVKITTNEGGSPILETTLEPMQITGRYYALVDILRTATTNATPENCPGNQPCTSELFQVRHYNPTTKKFDGATEIIRIPQQPLLPNKLFQSTPQGITDSPAGKAGWYIYGAKDREGMFTVQAVKPRSLFQLQPEQTIQGKTAGIKYIDRQNWQNTESRKGTIQSVLVIEEQGSKVDKLSPTHSLLKEGDYALVIHLFGGIGGEKGEPILAGTVTGHFSYGLAQVVRDTFTNELQFDIKYQQVYAQNSNGIISGTHHWENYMGNLEKGWLGTRPVSDVVIKLDALKDYDFGGVILSPFREFMYQLQIMTARYRTGDGTGVARVTPATSCVQDSSQALFIAIKSIENKFYSTPEIQTWLKSHPNDPQTLRFQQLVSLGKKLEKALVPRGVVRPDWQQNAEYLAGINARNGFVNEISIVNSILSWRSMMPRRAHDEVSAIFLESGAELWFLRTNQVGGYDPDIEPVAPTVALGQFPLISKLIERLIFASRLMNGQDWLVVGMTLLVYGAIALPLGFNSGFLQVSSGFSNIKELFQGLVMAFFTPALIEELIFRVFLLPHPTERVSTIMWWLWAGLSLFLFIIYHPINALTFHPQGNPTFMKPIFLTLTGILGLVCTVAYQLTGCLWVVVIIHWAVVVIWQYWLGGKEKLYGSN